MKIFVNAKANAKVNKVEKIDENHFNVWVSEPAVENRANFAILEALSISLNVSKSNIRLIAGEKNKNKIFEIKE